MNIGYCSPLPPQPSGIADYSAELLPALAGHVDGIELFVAAGSRPERPLAERFPVRPLGELAARAPALDAVLYHLGNDVRFHGEIYRAALEVPGVIVLHEYMLHHLVRGLTVDRHDPEGYVAAMERCYGPGGARAGRRFLDIGAGVERWFYPMFEEVVDASKGVICHNETTRRRVLASRPDAAVSVVQQHVSSVASGSGGPVERQVLGLPRDALLVGVFGLMARHKRLEVALAAFHTLRAERADARLLLVGDTSPHVDLPSLLAGELGEGVSLLGRVPLERFLAVMGVVDMAVNLRWPTGGETSATATRLLGLGVPTAVSNAGAFAELPDDVCMKIPVDEDEELTLAAALLVLAEDRELRRRLGARARAFMADHTVERSARAYATTLEKMAGRSPLHRHDGSRLQRGPESQLAALAGSALFDLGIDETDRPMLEVVGDVLRDLGVGR
jgi:glycosyltransferase involved in cell wall biosynthesis